jgi:hypothetical protein
MNTNEFVTNVIRSFGFFNSLIKFNILKRPGRKQVVPHFEPYLPAGRQVEHSKHRRTPWKFYVNLCLYCAYVVQIPN